MSHKKAIQFFEERTTLRKSKRRTALIDQIKQSQRPMTKAKALLKKFGQKDITVSLSRFSEDILSVSPYDPVFHDKVTLAKQKVKLGHWTYPEHNELIRILKDSWSPWSPEDVREVIDYKQYLRSKTNAK